MNRENTMDQLVNIELISSNNIKDINIDVDNSDTKIINNNQVNQREQRNDIIETCISVSIHTFIMAVFEIYFYFDYIVVIEKKLFMDKIEEYTIYFNGYYEEHISKEQHYILITILPKNQINQLLQILYEDYRQSLYEQKELLNNLLLKAYKMLIVVTSILILFFTIGIYYKKQINWTKIVYDNILMFISLGIFEYIFFMNIILHYSPVTDEEIKYTIAKNMLETFIIKNTTSPSSNPMSIFNIN